MRYRHLIQKYLIGIIYLDVSHAVIIKVGRSGEAFAAHGALVRLFATVDPSVRVERTRRRKSLAANVTHVRLFTCDLKNIYTILNFLRHFLSFVIVRRKQIFFGKMTVRDSKMANR